jgi:hypothetical protein
LPRIALGRALTEEAEYLDKYNESQTKKRIEYLKESAKAFHESGDISNFARLDYETKELSARYEADMGVANEMLSTAKCLFSEGMQTQTSTLDSLLKLKRIAGEMLSNAKRLFSEGMHTMSTLLLPLDSFLKLKESKQLVNHALEIYEKHSDEKLKEAYPLKNSIEPEFADVVKEMIWKLILYTVILFVIGTYVLRSVLKWRDDLTDSRLGNVLIR